MVSSLPPVSASHSAPVTEGRGGEASRSFCFEVVLGVGLATLWGVEASAGVTGRDDDAIDEGFADVAVVRFSRVGAVVELVVAPDPVRCNREVCADRRVPRAITGDVWLAGGLGRVVVLLTLLAAHDAARGSPAEK